MSNSGLPAKSNVDPIKYFMSNYQYYTVSNISSANYFSSAIETKFFTAIATTDTPFVTVKRLKNNLWKYLLDYYIIFCKLNKPGCAFPSTLFSLYRVSIVLQMLIYLAPGSGIWILRITWFSQNKSSCQRKVFPNEWCRESFVRATQICFVSLWPVVTVIVETIKIKSGQYNPNKILNTLIFTENFIVDSLLQI